MKISIPSLFRRVKEAKENGNEKRIEIPGPSDEQRQEWRDKILVSGMSIDSRWTSIKLADLETYKNANLPKFWRGSNELARRILSFDPEKATRAFLLFGKSGVGKTSILKALSINLARRTKDQVIFTQFKDVLDAMVVDDFAYKEIVATKLIQSRFVFIDDLGVERSSEWAHEQIYSILNKRLFSLTKEGKQKFTFFSTNLNLQQITSRYHDRDTRRLKDMAEFLEVR